MSQMITATAICLLVVSCSSPGHTRDLAHTELPIGLGVNIVLADAVCSGAVLEFQSVESDPKGHVVAHLEHCEEHAPVYVMLASSDDVGSVVERAPKKGTVFIRTITFDGRSWSQAIRIPRESWIYPRVLSEGELSVLRSTAIRRASAFLSDTASCDEAFSFEIEKIDGAEQQSVIDTLFSMDRLSRGQVQCLIGQLGSTSPLARNSFEPPFVSEEGVYHHTFSTRRQLLAYLLPHLTGFEMEFYDCGTDESCYADYIFAWAFWASAAYP